MPDRMAKSAETFLQDLRANVDAWYDGTTAHGTFTERQRAAWDAIRAAGPSVERAVLRELAEPRGAADAR